MNKKKTICILGYTGFIGSNLVDYFIEKGYKVIGVSRRDIENLPFYLLKFKDYLKKNLLEVFIADLTQSTSTRKLVNFLKKKKVKIIVNATGYVSLVETKVEQSRVERLNILPVINLFNAFKQLKFKPDLFVHLSSLAVYGRSSEVIAENLAKNPQTTYAKAKLKAETYVKEMSNKLKIKFIILQPSLIYGTRDLSSMVASLIQLALKYKIVPVIGKGKAKSIPITYINDLSKIIYEAINKKIKPDNEYIVVSEIVSQEELAEIIKRFTGAKIVKIPNLIAYSIAVIMPIFNKLLNLSFEYNVENIRKINTEYKINYKKLRYIKKEKIDQVLGKIIEWYCMYLGLYKQKINSDFYLKTAILEGEGLGTYYEYRARRRIIVKNLIKRFKFYPKNIVILGLPQKYGFSLDILLFCLLWNIYEIYVFDERQQKLEKFYKLSRLILKNLQIPEDTILLTLKKENLNNLKPLSKKVDLIISSEVLQRIKNKTEYFKFLNQNSKYNSLFAPNLLNISKVKSSETIRGLSLDELIKLAKEADIEVITAGYTDMPPQPSGKKLKRNIKKQFNFPEITIRDKILKFILDIWYYMIESNFIVRKILKKYVSSYSHIVYFVGKSIDNS